MLIVSVLLGHRIEFLIDIMSTKLIANLYKKIILVFLQMFSIIAEAILVQAISQHICDMVQRIYTYN